MLFVMFTLLIYIVTSSQTEEGNSCFPETFYVYVNILHYNEAHCLALVFQFLISCWPKTRNRTYNYGHKSKSPVH